jgi:hypothetical protein
MSVLLTCRTCGQPAMVPADSGPGAREDHCETCTCRGPATQGLRCLACGATESDPAPERLLDAVEAEAAFVLEHGITAESHWATKIGREREKVSRLKEGRW